MLQLAEIGSNHATNFIHSQYITLICHIYYGFYTFLEINFIENLPVHMKRLLII